MAELVDALVSKTSEVTLVPVRSRLRVLKKPFEIIFSKGFCFLRYRAYFEMKIKLNGFEVRKVVL